MVRVVTTTTIAATKGRRCNARQLLAVLRSTGASGQIGLRQVVDTGDGIMAKVGIKGGQKLIVKLNASDLFDIEIGHLVRRVDWKVDAQAHGISVGNLAAAVISLADGVLR